MRTNEIEVCARCTCGHNAIVFMTYPSIWECHCPRCYDGTEDASEIEQCRGHGESPSGAVSAWLEAMEAVSGFGFWPADLEWQMKAEAERQRNWQRLEDWYWGPVAVAAE